MMDKCYKSPIAYDEKRLSIKKKNQHLVILVFFVLFFKKATPALSFMHTDIKAHDNNITSDLDPIKMHFFI